MDDDLELLTRWQAEDKRAGDELVARHFGSVYRFFKYKVGDKEADDLSQQTFLQCVKALDAFRGQSSFRTYLLAIARNVLNQHFRKKSKREHVDVDFETSSIEALTSSPSGKLHREREKAKLIAALRSLPVDQQALLEWHYWEGLDAAELGEIYGLDQGAIRTRLSRARKALRELLAPDLVDKLASDRLVGSLSQRDQD